MAEELAFLSAGALANKIQNKEISSLELCDYYIDRIERLDASINAMPVRDFDGARSAASLADGVPESDRGSLHGVPMSIKESYNIVGLPTTWGVAGFKDIPITEDAEIVTRYKQAGAIFLGKTNVPVQLADFQSYNPIYGTTNNPWDQKRSPGGSSGGAAAALAAGLTGLEAGSDIGGSIRNPAHYCGVYGHKPTWGVVPPQGHALPGMLASPDIAVCGPLARSAEDLALSMDIIAGAEPLNHKGWRLELPRPKKSNLQDYKVAIWANDVNSPVDAMIENRVNEVGRMLEREGAKVSWDARPVMDVKKSHQSYMGLMHSIMGAGAGNDEYAMTQAAVSQLDKKDMSDMALLYRGMVLTHRDWLRLNNYRTKLRYVWEAFFKEYDVLICPQMATTAVEHDHTAMSKRSILVNGDRQNFFQQVYWSGLATVSYLPSTVFPTGLSEGGLPIGLQAIGGEYEDYKTIEFTRLIAQELGGFMAPTSL